LTGTIHKEIRLTVLKIPPFPTNTISDMLKTLDRQHYSTTNTIKFNFTLQATF